HHRSLPLASLRRPRSAHRYRRGLSAAQWRRLGMLRLRRRISPFHLRLLCDRARRNRPPRPHHGRRRNPPPHHALGLGIRRPHHLHGRRHQPFHRTENPRQLQTPARAGRNRTPRQSRRTRTHRPRPPRCPRPHPLRHRPQIRTRRTPPLLQPRPRFRGNHPGRVHRPQSP